MLFKKNFIKKNSKKRKGKEKISTLCSAALNHHWSPPAPLCDGSAPPWVQTSSALKRSRTMSSARLGPAPALSSSSLSEHVAPSPTSLFQRLQTHLACLPGRPKLFHLVSFPGWMDTRSHFTGSSHFTLLVYLRQPEDTEGLVPALPQALYLYSLQTLCNDIPLTPSSSDSQKHFWSPWSC